MRSQTDRELVSGWLQRCSGDTAEPGAAQADPGVLSVMTTPADRHARLAMDARHDLERRDLYRAKVDGPDAVSAERLRDLESKYELAAERLVTAEAELRIRD
jgi:hypothetical protein